MPNKDARLTKADATASALAQENQRLQRELTKVRTERARHPENGDGVLHQRVAVTRAFIARHRAERQSRTMCREVEGSLVLTNPRISTPPATPGADRRSLPALAPREHEVLDCIAEGITNQAIAERLAISEHTVKFHVGALLGKLSAATRAELVAIALRRGLIML